MESPESRICISKSCGKLNPSASAFCCHCGQNLLEEFLPPHDERLFFDEKRLALENQMRRLAVTGPATPELAEAIVVYAASLRDQAIQLHRTANTYQREADRHSAEYKSVGRGLDKLPRVIQVGALVLSVFNAGSGMAATHKWNKARNAAVACEEAATQFELKANESFGLRLDELRVAGASDKEISNVIKQFAKVLASHGFGERAKEWKRHAETINR
jgi:hypothetical protein